MHPPPIPQEVTDALAVLASESTSVALVAGRVVRQDRGFLRVWTPDGVHLGRVAGRLKSKARDALDLPCVGDWVALTPPEGGTARVHAVLPRRGVLVRRESEGTDPQPIAANVDQVLIVEGLDRPLNLRRIERLVLLARSCAAAPVVVLAKADTALDPSGAAEQVGATVPDVPVVTISASTGEGVPELEAFLTRDSVSVLLGPSGAGKSTLTNRLLGTEYLATAEVREGDAKGRHTTTHRELVELPSGAFLIDGPGMREFGLWAAEDAALGDAFADIAELAAGCRFNDCTHHAEPGCAVQAAVAAGTLPAARVENFHKLEHERANERSKLDPLARQERKRNERILSVAVKNYFRDTHKRK